MKSPTVQSLKLLRDEGYTCQVTEHWNPFAKRRVDLFGFCDILAVSPSKGTLAVQTTSADNFSHRKDKLREEPKASICLAAGWKIEVHGWGKQGPRGKRKVWTCRRERWVPPHSGLPTESVVVLSEDEPLMRIAGQRELFP